MLYLSYIDTRVLDLIGQVTELSKPSSLEVEEIIHRLVQNTSQRFFKDDRDSNFMGQSVTGNRENLPDGDDESCNTIDTSRDYLAKLLFWLEFCHSHS